MAHECYYVSMKSLGRKEETALAESSQSCKVVKKGDSEAVMILSASAEEHERPRRKPAAEVVEVPLHSSRLERLVRIGNALAPSVKEAIISLLQQYQDVFAFEPLEIKGIASDVM